MRIPTGDRNGCSVTLPGVEIERKFVYNKERFHVSGMGGVNNGRNKRYHHR